MRAGEVPSVGRGTPATAYLPVRAYVVLHPYHPDTEYAWLRASVPGCVSLMAPVSGQTLCIRALPMAKYSPVSVPVAPLKQRWDEHILVLRRGLLELWAG